MVAQDGLESMSLTFPNLGLIEGRLINRTALIINRGSGQSSDPLMSARLIADLEETVTRETQRSDRLPLVTVSVYLDHSFDQIEPVYRGRNRSMSSFWASSSLDRFSLPAPTSGLETAIL